MKKTILCVVFLGMGMLLAPAALMGQTPATDEEIALKEATTVKPPVARGLLAPVVPPVGAWLDLEKGIISFAFTEKLGSLTVLIEGKEGKIYAQYTVNGNAAKAVVNVPGLPNGEYKLSMFGKANNQQLHLLGYFYIP